MDEDEDTHAIEKGWRLPRVNSLSPKSLITEVLKLDIEDELLDTLD